ncbi:MAG: hypothetical protein AB7F19_07580 [Candidatus Babeliales bacterium]
MSKLAEMLARKKAEKEAAQQQETVTLKVPAEVAKAVDAAPEEAVKHLEKEAAALASAKPLTFAEKMAAKRAAEAAAKEAIPAPASSPAVEEHKAAVKAEEPKPVPSLKPEPPPQKQEASLVDEQKYADISARIKALADLQEESLENAMKELKKSLSENPNACALMLDEDLGLMVTALRRMNNVQVAEIKEGGKTKKPKAAKVALDADALAAAFDEL